MRKLAERKAEVKKEVVKKDQAIKKTEQVKRKVLLSSSSASSASSSSRSLSELHELRLRLEAIEGTLSQHIHICLGDNGVHDCGLKIIELEVNTKQFQIRVLPPRIHCANCMCLCFHVVSPA